MKKSIELNELYLQICDALSCGDDSFFEHCFSRKDGVIAIGTDPKEWWPGYNTIIRVFKTQLKEASGFKILPDTPQAYCEGSIGWLAGRPTIKLPDGTEIQIRLTAVFQKENNEWKIVQWHFSTGTPNEDLIGDKLTTQ